MRSFQARKMVSTLDGETLYCILALNSGYFLNDTPDRGS